MYCKKKISYQTLFQLGFSGQISRAMWLCIWDNQGLELEGDGITEINCVGPQLAHSQLVFLLRNTQLGNHNAK